MRRTKSLLLFKQFFLFCLFGGNGIVCEGFGVFNDIEPTFLSIQVRTTKCFSQHVQYTAAQQEGAEDREQGNGSE